MSKEPIPDPMDEAFAQEIARHLAAAAAVDRKRATYARLKEEAAALDLALVPATVPAPVHVLETLNDLFDVYLTAASSPYKKLTHSSRSHYDAVLGLVRKDRGTEVLTRLNADSFKSWYAIWSETGKTTMAFSKIKMVRLVLGYGNEVLHNPVCERLFGILAKLRFEKPKVRSEHLTVQQGIQIRAMAHTMKRSSIALAQAFQCDLGLLQKDVIGEWVPLENAAISDITDGNTKWVRGIRWNEVDQNMILRHQSEGWQGLVEFDLRTAPMVMEELQRQFNFTAGSPRFILPAAGPIILAEVRDGKPWVAVEFRRWWRKVADECGVPKNVRNADSRPRAKDGLQETSNQTEARLATKIERRAEARRDEIER